jgi:hypothetical protein
MPATSMLNNILYSKLPDVLQSNASQNYLILTLNPIVSLYEECKNTLSATFCRGSPPKDEDETTDWKTSPAREDLSDLAKRKMETI